MAPAHVMPSRLPPRDCVSRRGHGAGASPSVRSNARLSVALRDRLGGPGHAGSREEDLGINQEVYVAQDAYGADIARGLPAALSYVASSLAEPSPRIRESASLRSFNSISHVA